MRSVTILGSCVTRDAFEFTFGRYDIQNYFARTSFVSLTSPPIDIIESDIKLGSNFQRRCVFNDLSKSFFKETKDKKTDLIIIDLIDERFNLIKTGDSYITKSNEYVTSNIEENFIPTTEIKRTEELFPLWKQAADKLFKKLFETYKPEEIILHKTLWRDRYYELNGKQHSFEKMLTGINHHNQLLTKYYDYIVSSQPKIRVIDMTVGGFLASEKHKWGISPFHYEDVYYHAFLLHLEELTRETIKQ